MRISGTVKRNEDSKTLEEVRFACTPQELRVIAQFLLGEADELEKHGDDYYHAHLRDDWKLWKPEYGDVIVNNPSKLPKPS